MKCMWNNTAYFLMVKVKVQNRRSFSIPIPLRVVDEWFEALADIVRIGETAFRFVPISLETTARKQMTWLRTLSPSRMIRTLNVLLRDMGHHKGLEIVNVETGDVQVKIHLR